MNPQSDPISGAELRALMVAATDDRPPGIDVPGAIRPAPRRSWRRPVISAVAVAGTAAASVVVLTSLTDAPSAQAQVAAAAKQTAKERFRVHITTTSPKGRQTYDGAFDPARRIGRLTGGGVESRYIGNTVYTKGAIPSPKGRNWVSMPWQLPGQGTSLTTSLIKQIPQNPAQTLELLREGARVRREGAVTGHGWHGRRYSFRADERDAKRAAELSGTVDVDSRGRVRKLDLTVRARGGEVIAHNVMEFADYGTRVSVPVPSAGEVDWAVPRK